MFFKQGRFGPEQIVSLRPKLGKDGKVYPVGYFQISGKMYHLEISSYVKSNVDKRGKEVCGYMVIRPAQDRNQTAQAFGNSPYERGWSHRNSGTPLF